MGSKDKYFGILSSSHGFDDIGFAQGVGTITAVAKYGAGKWNKYAMVTENAAHSLTKGMTVNITGTTDYDGPTRVIAIVSTTKYVIDRPFTITKTGARDGKQAEGNWDGFMPIGADVPAGNLTLTFWDPNQQGGLDTSTDFTKNILYRTPGGIKRAIMGTAGTSATAASIRLMRAASVRPGNVRNPSAPVVVGYNPTGGTAGAVVDILGQNFDPAMSNNVVKFNGTVAYPTQITKDVITVPIPSGATSGAITVTTFGVNATGPTGFTIA